MGISVHFSSVAQSCLTLCDPMDCSLPGSSVHGIFQARVLEWVAISFSKGSSQPRDRTRVSRIAGRRFTIWATREDGVWMYVWMYGCHQTHQIVYIKYVLCFVCQLYPDIASLKNISKRESEWENVISSIYASSFLKITFLCDSGCHHFSPCSRLQPNQSFCLFSLLLLPFILSFFNNIFVFWNIPFIQNSMLINEQLTGYEQKKL